MTPWFVLSYPRSRTAWLSVFLTGAGVPCFHEAWAHVTTAKQLRALMESKGEGPVVNSDCSNVFFFDELRAEFPNAHYLRLYQTDAAITASLQSSYGDNNYQDMFASYARAFEHVSSSLLRWTAVIDCSMWNETTSAWLYRTIAGREVDAGWLKQVSGMLVELLPGTIAEQQANGARGAFVHIARRMVSA